MEKQVGAPMLTLPLPNLLEVMLYAPNYAYRLNIYNLNILKVTLNPRCEIGSERS